MSDSMQPGRIVGDYSTRADGKDIAGAAIRMSLGTLSSRILGLFRDLLLAALFGRVFTDAFAVAFRLPNIARRVLGEGSVGAAFTPQYTEAKDRQSGDSAQFARVIGAFLALGAAVITAVVIVLMPAILKVIVTRSAHFSNNPEAFLAVVTMGRVMFGYFFFATLYAYFSALAQAHGQFFRPAMAAAAFNAVIIAGLLLAKYYFAVEIQPQVVAFSVVFGGVIQCLITVAALDAGTRRNILKPQFAVSELRQYGPRFMAQLLPSVASLSGGQAVTLLNIFFAAQFTIGSLSYMYLADRLFELPLSLIAVSLGSALLPRLSNLYSRKDHVLYSTTYSEQLLNLLSLILPSSIGLYILATPISVALFEHGQFRHPEALLTAELIKINAITLVFVAISRLALAALHSGQFYRAAARATLLGLAVHPVFAVLVLHYHPDILGLLYATLATTVVVCTLLQIELYRNLKLRVAWSGLAKSLALPNFALLISTVALAYLFGFTDGQLTKGNNLMHHFRYFGTLMVIIFASAAIYIQLCRKKRIGYFAHLDFYKILDRLRKKQ